MSETPVMPAEVAWGEDFFIVPSEEQGRLKGIIEEVLDYCENERQHGAITPSEVLDFVDERYPGRFEVEKGPGYAFELLNNLVVWHRLTPDGVGLLAALCMGDDAPMKLGIPKTGTGVLIIRSTSRTIVSIPMAKQVREYATPHWLPTYLELRK